MTRDQIKNKIEDIIVEYTYAGPYAIQGLEEAAEEIMKLWDQGFVYEIKAKEE